MTDMTIIIISNIIELFLFTYYYRFMLTLKKVNKTLFIVAYLVALIVKSLFNLYAVANLNILISFSIYLILIMLFTNSKFSYKLLLLGIYFGLSIFAESLTFHIFMIFIQWNEYVFVQMLISKLCMLILVLFIKNFKRLKNESDVNFKSMLLLAIQPISIIFFIYVTNGELILKSNDRALILISLLLLIISNLTSFYVLGEIIHNKKIEKELLFEKERSKESELYYQHLKDNIESFKAYRHDLSRHFGILKSMLYSEKYTFAKDYVNTLSNDIVQMSDKRSGDEFLDLVLLSRQHKIIELNIEMVYEIRKIDLAHISRFDLNVIYSNIIDNAITSCSKCKNRKIVIQTMQANERYQIIKITNSCDSVKVINGEYVTTKADYNNHNYGLSNIKSTVVKYNGFVKYIFDEDRKEFQTILYFNNMK